MITVGIDYSMSCPGITVHHGVEWTHENCEFYFFIKPKAKIDYERYEGDLGYNVYGKVQPWEYSSEEERYHTIMRWAMDIVLPPGRHPKDVYIGLEGYSMGSKGQVFQIGENTGILKHEVYMRGCPVKIYSPNTIKLFGGKHGHADKQKMYDCFMEETKIPIKEILKFKRNKIDSPLADLIDSYSICKKRFYDERGYIDGTSGSKA